MSDIQKDLRATGCWNALVGLVADAVGQADVQICTDRDFLEGKLVLRPPTVRAIYAGTGASAIESQRTAYELVHRFMLLCGDENQRSSEDQAFSSLMLGEQVIEAVSGARLRLSSGEVSEPITFISIDSIPVDGFGVAYGVSVEVPGPAVFPGTYAQPALIPGEN